jgi:hypothetical protein
MDGSQPSFSTTCRGFDVLCGVVRTPPYLRPRPRRSPSPVAFRRLPTADAEAAEPDRLPLSHCHRATRLPRHGCAPPRTPRQVNPVPCAALLIRSGVVEPKVNRVRRMTSGCVVLDMRLRIEQRRPARHVLTLGFTRLRDRASASVAPFTLQEKCGNPLLWRPLGCRIASRASSISSKTVVSNLVALRVRATARAIAAALALSDASAKRSPWNSRTRARGSLVS